MSTTRWLGHVLLLGLWAATAACGDDPAAVEGSELLVEVDALSAGDLGITRVVVTFSKTDAPLRGTTFDVVLPLDAGGAASTSNRVVHGMWQVQASAEDDAGNSFGGAGTLLQVPPGQRVRAALAIHPRGNGNLSTTIVVCHDHVHTISTPNMVELGETFSVTATSQAEVTGISADLADGYGAILESVAMTPIGTGTTWTGTLTAPGGSTPLTGAGLYFVNINSTGSYGPPCDTQTDGVALLVTDPEGPPFVGSASNPISGVAGFAVEADGVVITVDNDYAFSPVAGTEDLQYDAILRELGLPVDEDCGGVTVDCTDPSAACQTTTDVTETQPLPADFDTSAGTTWAGADAGGCGTWAVLMCNRFLDIDADLNGTADEVVDEDEWNTVASGIDLNLDGDTRDPHEVPGIDQDGDGVATPASEARFYTALGCSAFRARFGGSEHDYQVLASARARGCDLKAAMYAINPDGSVAYGHMETITDVGTDSMTTNSWGKPAILTGGSFSDFTHSQADGDPDDNFADGFFPASSTEIFIEAICCP